MAGPHGVVNYIFWFCVVVYLLIAWVLLAFLDWLFFG